MTDRAWRDDFTNYYFEGDRLVGLPASQVPDNKFYDACTISDAVRFLQHLGCIGRCIHTPTSEYHRACIATLKRATDIYGETFQLLFRGVRSDRPDSEYKILYGTTHRDIASFYGKILEYRQVKGLRTRTLAKSVVTNDYSQDDEEIIFFPQ